MTNTNVNNSPLFGQVKSGRSTAMKLSDPDIREVVEKATLSFAAMVCADGSPNLSPKGSMRVYDESHLAFMDIASPDTMANLRRDPPRWAPGL